MYFGLRMPTLVGSRDISKLGFKKATLSCGAEILAFFGLRKLT